MQFIPGTWAMFAVDGDADGKSDPFDIDDVALAAAATTCAAAGGDLRTEAGQRDAVYSYNRSDDVRATGPGSGRRSMRGAPGSTRCRRRTATRRPLPPAKKPTLPPVKVGPPPAATPTPTPTPTTPEPTTPAPDDRRAHDDGSEHAPAPRRRAPRRRATSHRRRRRQVHAGPDANGDADRDAHGHADRDADESDADSHGNPDGHRDAHANADRVADAAALPDAVAVRADRAAGDAPPDPNAPAVAPGINR